MSAKQRLGSIATKKRCSGSNTGTDLTGPGIESQPSRTYSNVLTTEVASLQVHKHCSSQPQNYVPHGLILTQSLSLYQLGQLIGYCCIWLQIINFKHKDARNCFSKQSTDSKRSRFPKAKLRYSLMQTKLLYIRITRDALMKIFVSILK